MSGPYAHPQTGPPSPNLGAPRLIAAALLVVAAALAVGGTFLALSVRRYDFGLPGPTVVATTGWTVNIEGAPGMSNPPGAAPLGIPVVVAAGLAAVAAILLLLSVRRSGDHVLARIAGIGAVGLLVGSVWIIWIELFTLASNATAAAVMNGSDGGFHPVVVFGAGAWLLLAAALLALACIPLLAMPPADAVSAEGRVPYGSEQEPTSPWSRSPGPAAAPPVPPGTPPAGAPPVSPGTPPGGVPPVAPGTPPAGVPPVSSDSPADDSPPPGSPSSPSVKPPPSAPHQP